MHDRGLSLFQEDDDKAKKRKAFRIKEEYGYDKKMNTIRIDIGIAIERSNTECMDK